MSLRVWLPLTKNLRNQGLSNVTVTNNGATYSSTGGKLGGCYTFDGNDYIRISMPSEMITLKGISVAAWVKSTSSTLALGGISNDVNYTVPMCTLYTSGWQFGNDAQNGYRYVSGGTIANTNTWHHVCCTVSDTTITTYLDGVQVASSAISGVTTFTSANFIEIGCDHPGGDEYLTGSVNDFRIYDHALSPLEVKQISQGLILHYPLNRNGWGNENILLNTHFDKQYVQSTGWDTTKNGTQLANFWGGYNSGVNNQTTVYHAHLKKFNEEWVYEFIKTTNENWLGISQGGLQTKITPGNIYTFSWEQYCESGNNYNHGGLYYYKTGASSANFHLGSFAGNTNRKIGQWQKYSYTFTAPTDGDYSKNMSWYIYGMNGGNGVLYTRHLKLEKGSIATPWCPNSADELYNILGLNNNIQYDTSGYGNNGTKKGTFDYNSDTPKYNVSTIFNGTDNAIQTPNLTTMVTDKNYTVSCWINKATIGSKNYQTIYGGPSGFELEARSSSNASPLFRIHNWGGGTTPYEFNKWYHFCFVHSDTDSKLYINGELKITGTSSTIPSGDYFIGSWKNSTSQNYDGKISDLYFLYITIPHILIIKEIYMELYTRRYNYGG